jgi:hypothetical protein
MKVPDGRRSSGRIELSVNPSASSINGSLLSKQFAWLLMLVMQFGER